MALLCRALPGAAAGADLCVSSADCLQRLREAQSQTRTLAADFVQTKHLSLLAQPLTSSGHFTFKAPDRIRWQVEKPQPLTILINGRDVDIPGLSTSDRDALAQAPLASLFTELGAVFTGSLDRLQESFAVDAGAHQADIWLKLAPRQDSWKRLFRRIDIEFAAPAFLPQRMRLENAFGDRIDIEWTNVRRNLEVPDSAFRRGAGGG